MRLREKGEIGRIGVCNFGVFDLQEAEGVSLTSNQLPYSLMWRVIEDEIIAETRRCGMGILVYSALLHGLLSGRYSKLSDFPDGRARTRHFAPSRPGVRHQEAGFEVLTQSLLDRAREIATRAGFSLLEIALGFVLSRPFIDSVLFGSRTPEQLKQLVAASEQEIPQELLMELTNASEELRRAAGGNPDLYQTDSRIRHGGAEDKS